MFQKQYIVVFLGKVVAAMWWMTGTIFVSTYTANLAAFLTVNKSAIDIRSFEDLANQDEIKYGTVKDTQPSMFFERSKIPIYQKMWGRMKSSGGLTVSIEYVKLKKENIGIKEANKWREKSGNETIQEGWI